MKAIKSDTDSVSDEQKKVVRFSGKNRGVTPSVAAPGVTHPSDATGDCDGSPFPLNAWQRYMLMFREAGLCTVYL